MLKRLKLKTMMIAMVVFSTVMLLGVQLAYYVQFAALSRERMETNVSSIMEQTKAQLDNYVENMISTAENIANNRYVQEFFYTKDASRKYVELAPFVMNLLSSPTVSNSYFEAIFALNVDGNIVTPTQTHEIEVMQRILQGENLAADYSSAPGFTRCVEYDETLYCAYIHPVINSSGGSRLFACLGYCVILVKTESLATFLTGISTPNLQICILNAEGYVIAGNGAEMIGQKMEAEPEINDGRRVRQERSIDGSGWIIVCDVPQTDFLNDMMPIIRNGLIAGVVVTLCMMLISSLFVHSINSSILQLLRFLQSAGDHQVTQERIHMNRENEITVISTWVNRMLDRIEDANNRVVKTQSQLYEAEISKTRMELLMLQNLINPHFLYNTMNCISSIGLAHGVPDITAICSAVSHIFRYGIDDRDIVAVHEEFSCVDEYLKIMKFRYGDKLSYTVSLPDELREQKMPKMILQPVVENALYHGIERKRGRGHLEILCAQQNGEIWLTVKDDGKGMSDEELRALRERLKGSRSSNVNAASVGGHSRLGLTVIHRRLKLLYGDEYGIQIQSEWDRGTEVISRFPKLP